MKTLKYRDAIYVEAASTHRRCKTGTHWNEKQKKCMKLPPDLAGAVNRSHAVAKKADSMSVKSAKQLRSKTQQHHEAYSSHYNTAKQARQMGFLELANNHSKISRNHLRKYHRLAFPKKGTKVDQLKREPAKIDMTQKEWNQGVKELHRKKKN